MLDDAVKKFLLNKEETSHLNFKLLHSWLTTLKVNIINSSIKNASALSTFNVIYVDLEHLNKHYKDDLIFFIFIHEIAHYKRMCKLGKEKILANLSLNDFDLFSDNIVSEELIADRYASLLFYIFNGILYPREKTQRLTETFFKTIYKKNTIKYFNVINNSEENYNNFIKKIIN
jgi:hypothetical protein